jgi:DNA-binding NtrC family response regulator
LQLNRAGHREPTLLGQANLESWGEAVQDAPHTDGPSIRATSRGQIVSEHESVQNVLALVDRIAASSCTVLVTGESGTGKELVVAALHDASPRAQAPLVTINCGAIPENLLETELFGHAKGSFTGAHASRQGRVASAEGGTLFLDEVGELPLQLQVKILRLLQQREYSPVGDARVFKSDVRIVAATNRDLDEEVARGRFREDLFYRLNVIHLHLPPLRDRVGDIPHLAEHFRKLHVERSGRSDVTGFAQEALDLLKTSDWPGNIRALENAIERAVLLSRGPLIQPADLPDRVRRPGSPHEIVTELPPDGLDLRAVVDIYETSLIRQALQRTSGNKNRAAQLLGLNRTTLVDMVRRKGL